MSSTLYPGDIATTPAGDLVVILTHIDSPTGGTSVLARAVRDGLPVGVSLAYEPATLQRAFLPVEQARTVYAAVNGVPLEQVPALPIGCREYAEQRVVVQEVARRARLCPACEQGPGACLGHADDPDQRKIVARHFSDDHTLCAATVCGPWPSVAELLAIDSPAAAAGLLEEWCAAEQEAARLREVGRMFALLVTVDPGYGSFVVTLIDSYRRHGRRWQADELGSTYGQHLVLVRRLTATDGPASETCQSCGWRFPNPALLTH